MTTLALVALILLTADVLLGTALCLVGARRHRAGVSFEAQLHAPRRPAVAGSGGPLRRDRPSPSGRGPVRSGRPLVHS